ncbi:MAG: hypothetical protein IKT17_03835, partial [Lachnospiraceae bacterium]|nr:hypothetical protein [Lachnospiraceae bacterium]
WTLEELNLSDVVEETADDGFEELPDDESYEEDDHDALDDADETEATDDALDLMMADTLDALKKVKEAMEPSGTGKANEKAGEDAADNAGEETGGPSGTSIVVKVNGEDVTLTGKNDYIYVDVFEFIDFDLSKPQGHAVVTRLNGRTAVFNEQIKAGDVIEVYWEK